MERYDEDDLYADLSADVFRHRYVIHLEDPSRMQETKLLVENVDGIAKVRGDEAVSNGFITLRNVASLISVALVAVLLVVSLFIISNTIKLTTFDRREEIAIMKMVGATNGFIRWPFVFEGLLLGVLGAVVAFLLQWVLYMAMCRGIAASDTLQLLRIVPFVRIWEIVAVVFGAAGLL
ncbi:MAG: FtsX-like permease family protein, partial [Ruminococcus sp.]|nr:FtsX-like permease family protein [Ruminococcus sp.]